MKIKNSSPAHSEATGNQQHDERTMLALNAVCRSESQSYDQFMANFTYLTPADMANNAVHVSNGVDDDWQPPLLTSQPVSQSSKTQPHVEGVTQLEDIDCSKQGLDTPQTQELLVEETLAEGTLSQPILSRSKQEQKAIKLKMGNFVDEDDDVSEEEGDWYTPSFSAGAASSLTVTNKDIGAFAPKELATGLAISSNIETSQPKAIAMLEELAILQHQNSDNEHVSVKHHGNSSSANLNYAPTMLDELAAIKSGQKVMDMPKASASMEFSMAGTSVSDLDLPETERCDIAAQVMAQARISKVENSTSHTDNGEENILDLIGQDDDQSDGEEEVDNNEYDASLDILNPGEVTEEKEVFVKDFVTKLKFTAHSRESMGDAAPTYHMRDSNSPQNDEKAEESTNEVHAFSLDENFDYDNVVLSAKYNEQEISIIMNAMKGTAQEQMASTD